MMKKNRLISLSLGAVFTSLIFHVNAFADTPSGVMKLPAVGADIHETSVSGLSSGAFMTSQFFVAHSGIMRGAGIVAGGPYLCAQSWPINSYLTNAMTTCMDPITESVGPNTPLLIKKTKALSQGGDIDSISNLKNTHLYLFSGTKDHTVSTLVMDQTLKFYEDLGIDSRDIYYNKKVDAGHAFITTSRFNSCSKTEPPYINDCDIPQAKRILQQIYPNLDTTHTSKTAAAVPFDESEFIDAKYTSMDKVGYVYIPSQCKGGQHTPCKVHVVFHGCQQGATVIGNKYYDQTGYNAYADANNLIFLYPQVHPSPKLTSTEPYNPKGCWDFWGYSSPNTPTPDYFSKKSPQISAVFHMIERLTRQP